MKNIDIKPYSRRCPTIREAAKRCRDPHILYRIPECFLSVLIIVQHVPELVEIILLVQIPYAPLISAVNMPISLLKENFYCPIKMVNKCLWGCINIVFKRCLWDLKKVKKKRRMKPNVSYAS